MLLGVLSLCAEPVCVTGTETAGTATTAVFLSTRSGFSVPAGGLGFLPPAAELTSDW